MRGPIPRSEASEMYEGQGGPECDHRSAEQPNAGWERHAAVLQQRPKSGAPRTARFQVHRPTPLSHGPRATRCAGLALAAGAVAAGGSTRRASVSAGRMHWPGHLVWGAREWNVVVGDLRPPLWTAFVCCGARAGSLRRLNHGVARHRRWRAILRSAELNDPIALSDPPATEALECHGWSRVGAPCPESERLCSVKSKPGEAASQPFRFSGLGGARALPLSLGTMRRRGFGRGLPRFSAGGSAREVGQHSATDSWTTELTAHASQALPPLSCLLEPAGRLKPWQRFVRTRALCARDTGRLTAQGGRGLASLCGDDLLGPTSTSPSLARTTDEDRSLGPP